VKPLENVSKESFTHFASITIPLDEFPLFRLAFASRPTSDETYFLFVIPHVVIDGLSIDIFYRELSAYYSAYARGDRAFSLSRPSLQYPSFSQSQREEALSPLFQQHREFWLKNLENCSPYLNLPFDFAPSTTIDSTQIRSTTAIGDYVHFRISREKLCSLKRLSARFDATLFTAVHVTFSILLYLWTGQSDFNIGMPHGNRAQNEAQDAMGCFINMLVLRTQLSGKFIDLFIKV
jgi:hypothetical protein